MLEVRSRTLKSGRQTSFQSNLIDFRARAIITGSSGCFTSLTYQTGNLSNLSTFQTGFQGLTEI
ncbi:hypothetical protein PanWU01x14_231210 [Parasponia andersonii]|uniref:Uncharacterized protein n=1 Tax=Parasponia andersonii TaxID=3476 RepID=A0A2P5BKF3_PARAD|nr:hypothetical protein PanWU01x14_231210 [Parasponia andersonii]